MVVDCHHKDKLNSMVINAKSIFPVSGIKKSQIRKAMVQSANPFIQPGINDVYIRPIEDSREIDLENQMQKNL